MELFSSVKADLAIAGISGLCLALVVEGKFAAIPLPWNIAVCLIPVAFLVWFVFLVRKSLHDKRERQYAGFWGIWQRPIIATIGFMVVFVLSFSKRA